MNKVESAFSVSLPFKVENAFCDVDDNRGFTIFKTGWDGNPQIFCHMEMMGIRDGHHQTRLRQFEDFTDDDAEENAAEGEQMET